MARPKKAPEDRKEESIHIPVTAEEKARITEAAGLASSSGYTVWVREIVLKAADKVLQKQRGKDGQGPS